MSGGPGRNQGRRAGYVHATVTKNRIRAGRLLFMLYKAAAGEHEMTPAQIAAATVFLRKVIPDLKQIDHTGEIAHRHVTELSDAELLSIAASSSAGTAEAQEGEGEPARLHRVQ